MNPTIFLGVDAGCYEHTCAAINEKKELVWEERIPNTHQGCDRILEQVKRWKQQGLEIWAGAEGIGGYVSPLDGRLLEANCHYVNLPPLQVRKFREMTSIQPDKDDEKDARLLAGFLQFQHDQGTIQACKPQHEYFHTLKMMARTFHQTLKAKVTSQNQLVSLVRESWPELVTTNEFFSRTDARGLLALLIKYPAPEKVAKAGKSRVNKVLSRASKQEQRGLAEALVKHARQIAKHVRLSASHADLIRSMAQILLRLVESVKELEGHLEKQVLQHPFGQWLLGQEGIGPRTAGSFLGEAGDLSRFASDAKLARYAGMGMNKSQSGQSKGY